MRSDAYNIDCLEYMRALPDKYFDLAIADPPYGINADRDQMHRAGKRFGHQAAKCRDYGVSDWDREAPGKEFFIELCRVSQHQIIWGANHFIENIPSPNASCWIVWDKETGDNSYADCELAWTSLPGAVRKFRYKWHGMIQENMANKEERIHPTQKPVSLYGWLIGKYAPSGGVIFDPMMGSQSSRIAAYKMGFDYVGCELDKEYFAKGCERFNQECLGEYVTKQGTVIKEQDLFDL